MCTYEKCHCYHSWRVYLALFLAPMHGWSFIVDGRKMGAMTDGHRKYPKSRSLCVLMHLKRCCNIYNYSYSPKP